MRFWSLFLDEGLSLSRVKSHLQKCRLGVRAGKSAWMGAVPLHLQGVAGLQRACPSWQFWRFLS